MVRFVLESGPVGGETEGLVLAGLDGGWMSFSIERDGLWEKRVKLW